MGSLDANAPGGGAQNAAKDTGNRGTPPGTSGGRDGTPGAGGGPQPLGKDAGSRGTPPAGKGLIGGASPGHQP